MFRVYMMITFLLVPWQLSDFVGTSLTNFRDALKRSGVINTRQMCAENIFYFKITHKRRASSLVSKHGLPQQLIQPTTAEKHHMKLSERLNFTQFLLNLDSLLQSIFC